MSDLGNKPNKRGVVTFYVPEGVPWFNLSSFSNNRVKKVIINCAGNNKTISGSQYNDVINLGIGDTIVHGDKGNDIIYSNENGDNKFTFNDCDGNDLIFNSKKSDIIEIFTSDDFEPKLLRKRSNLEIIYSSAIKLNKKNTKKADSITLINFFDSANKENNIEEIEFNCKKVSLTENYYSVSGKGKIFGTDYNDNIIGSKKKDTIYTGAGNDRITPGKGKDKIIIDGNGQKDICIHNGDGNDKIIDKTLYTADINLIFDEEDYLSCVENADKTVSIMRTYVKNGSVKTEITNIDDIKFRINNEEYFPGCGAWHTYTSGKPNKNKQHLYSTGGNSVIVGGNKADIIWCIDTTDNVLFGGKGKDTFNIQGGENIIYSGKGNDIINIFDSEAFSNINTLYFENSGGNDLLNIYDVNSKTALEFSTDNISFFKKGNDLQLKASYKMGKKKITDTLTIRVCNSQSLDIYNEDLLKNITVNEKSLFDLLDTSLISVTGVSEKKQKKIIYNSANDFASIITHKSNKSAYIIGGNRDDIFNIKSFSKKSGFIEIRDRAGEDTLSIKVNTQDLRLLFNVDNNGNIVLNNSINKENNNFQGDNFVADLYIINKSTLNIRNLNNLDQNSAKLKGVINLSEYFAYDENNFESDGTNYIRNIEHIKTKNSGDGELKINQAIGILATKVGEFLKTTNFKNSFELLQNGTKKVREMLLNIYKSVTIEIATSDQLLKASTNSVLTNSNVNSSVLPDEGITDQVSDNIKSEIAGWLNSNSGIQGNSAEQISTLNLSELFLSTTTEMPNLMYDKK